MSPKLPSLVWCPGLWLPTEIYRKAAGQLAEYRSVFIDLPTGKMRPGSQDMHEDLDLIRQVILGELDAGHDVVLMGHSAGGILGFIAAQGLSKVERQAAGKSNGIIGSIGVATILPYPGKTIFDMNVEYGAPQQVELSQKLDLAYVPVDEYMAAYKINEDGTNDCIDSYRLMYCDLPVDEAQPWIAKHSTASTAIYMVKGPENPITEIIPSYYVYPTRDAAILYGCREEYVKHITAAKPERVLKMEADHVPHLSHPNELERLFRKALGEISELS